MSALPGRTLEELFEENGWQFPFWIAPYHQGPTIARVFGFWYERGVGPTTDFAVNVYNLDEGTWLMHGSGRPLIARASNDAQRGWVSVHLDQLPAS